MPECGQEEPMDMSLVLRDVERALPRLLIDRAGWNGIYADTRKPHLRRLWRQYGEYRINLHFFDGMEAGDDAFAHPHPWAFAVRIHEGIYLMDIGRDVTGMDVQVELVPGCMY